MVPNSMSASCNDWLHMTLDPPSGLAQPSVAPRLTAGASPPQTGTLCTRTGGEETITPNEGDRVDTDRPRIKNLSAADETLALPKGWASTVRIGELVVGRLELEPGWRWSTHVRPIAGTASCKFHHVGVVLSGAVDGRMDDGTPFGVRPGDVFDIPPGHDNWVVGDASAVMVVWGGWRGWGKPPVGERILTTILMTDIADSTHRASAIGDAAWDQLLDRHHALVREVLERYRGTEIDTAGDGFLTMFDGAARAVQAALEIRVAVRDIGLDIRAGVHTGEVELVPGADRRVGSRLRGPRDPPPEGHSRSTAGVRARHGGGRRLGSTQVAG